MNYSHIALAFLGATVAYFVSGGIMFFALPAMKSEFLKHPDVYRSDEGMKKAMPYNMVGILISIAIAVTFYAKIYPVGGGIASGLYLGVLMGIYSICIYAIHNYALLNISIKLTIYESITYFIQWVIVGAAIGLIYKTS